jgi:hypothetical protein
METVNPNDLTVLHGISNISDQAVVKASRQIARGRCFENRRCSLLSRGDGRGGYGSCQQRAGG